MNSFGEIINDLSSEYHEYRKNIMERFQMSAIEVDVMLFLANNPDYDMAADVARGRKISKSHVSLAVRNLIQKGYLLGRTDEKDHKKVHLQIQKAAEEMIDYGRNQQQQFAQSLLDGFTPEERELYLRLSERLFEGLHRRQKERRHKKSGIKN